MASGLFKQRIIYTLMCDITTLIDYLQYDFSYVFRNEHKLNFVESFIIGSFDAGHIEKGNI